MNWQSGNVKRWGMMGLLSMCVLFSIGSIVLHGALCKALSSIGACCVALFAGVQFVKAIKGGRK